MEPSPLAILRDIADLMDSQPHGIAKLLLGKAARADFRNALIYALEAVDAVSWRPISSLPEDGSMVLASTDDGRTMVWRADILSRNLRGPTPGHLAFPATAWLPIPQREANRADH